MEAEEGKDGWGSNSAYLRRGGGQTRGEGNVECRWGPHVWMFSHQEVALLERIREHGFVGVAVSLLE